MKLYIDTYKKFNKYEGKNIIVLKRYPFGVYDDEIIFVGYVIERSKI